MVIALVFEHFRGKVFPVSEMLFYIYTVCLFFLIHASPFSVFLSRTHRKWGVIIKGRFQRQSQLKVDIEERTRNGNLFEHRHFFFASFLNQEVSDFFFFF